MQAAHFQALLHRTGQQVEWWSASSGYRYCGPAEVQVMQAAALPGGLPQPALMVTVPAAGVPPGVTPEPGDAIQWQGRRFTIEGLPSPIQARAVCLGWRCNCLG